MQIRSLQAFIAVMESGTVTAAAARLRRTQPQISRLLVALEEEIGFQLFIRQRQRLTPSPEGSAFYREAIRAVASFDKIRDVAQDIRLGRETRLHILSPPHAAQYLIPKAIVAFADRHRQVAFSLEIFSHGDIHQRVAGDPFDIGIVASPLVHPAISNRPFAAASVVAILPKGHHLSDRAYLEPEDFAGEPLIALQAQTLLREYTELVFEKHNVPISIRAEASTGHSVCCLVAEGLGIGLADPFTAEALREKGLVIRAWRPRYEFKYSFIFPRAAQLTRTVAAFAETTVNVATTLAPPFVRRLDPRRG
jgi:DNA-binding transcriptional LysR family regulator